MESTYVWRSNRCNDVICVEINMHRHRHRQHAQHTAKIQTRIAIIIPDVLSRGGDVNYLPTSIQKHISALRAALRDIYI